jgi:transcriptional regulator with XRE-family HTH domain
MAKSIYTQEHQSLQNLLKKLRRQAGLTQETLAQRLKMPQSFVSKYESGERRLDVLELRHVCTVLEIGVSEFAKLLEKEIKNAP